MKVQLSLALMLLYVSKAHGQSQYLDSNFNGTGFLQTDYKAKSFDEISNIKLSNGALYAFGRVEISDYKFYESGFGVLKHNLTSGLDTSFGNQGKAHYYFDSYQRAISFKDVYAYSDGSLLLLSEMGLVKINENGVLDPNFGFNGKKDFEPGFNVEFNKLLILPNGKIYVFGKKEDNLYIERYNADGFYDFSFGNQGSLMIDLGTSETINDAKLLNDGKILIIGNSKKQINNNSSGNTRYNIIRKINQDGTVDPSFVYDAIPDIYDNIGNFKKIIINDANTYGYLVNQVDGCNSRILKVNLQTQAVSNFPLTSGGSSWPCWGSAGYFIINDIVLDNDKIYLAGNQSASSSNPSMSISRYNLDGTIDTAFANQGGFNYFSYTGSPTSPVSSIVNLQSIQIAADGSVYGGGRYNNDFLVFKIVKSVYLDTNEIKNGKDNILKIYPNPVKDFLFADAKNLTGNIQISVYDMSGKIVKKQIFNSINDHKVSIDLSDLVTGNYVVKYEAKDFSQSVRIIKK